MPIPVISLEQEATIENQTETSLANKAENLAEHAVALVNTLVESGKLTDEEKREAQRAVSNLKKFSGNLDPNGTEDAQNAFFESLRVTSDQWRALPEHERQALARANPEYYTFRTHFGETVSIINEYLEKAQTNPRMRLVAFKLIDAITNKKFDEEAQNRFVQELVGRDAALMNGLNPSEKNNYKQVDFAHAKKVAEAIKSFADSTPEPYDKFRQNFRRGPQNRPTEIRINDYNRRRRYKRANIIETFDGLLTNTDQPLWETEKPTIKGTYDNWSAEVEQNIATGLLQRSSIPDLTRHERLVMESGGFLGTNKHPRQGKSVIELEDARARRQDENGAIASAKVKMLKVDFKTTMFKSEYYGTDLGEAITDEKLMYDVTVYTAQYKNIVEVSEGLEQLAAAAQNERDENAQARSYKVPYMQKVRKVDENGRAFVATVKSWVIVDADTFSDWQKALQKSMDSFVKAGFDLEKERKRLRPSNDARMHLVEDAYEAGSWIGYERARMFIDERFNRALEQNKHPSILSSGLKEAQSGVNNLYRDFVENYKNLHAYTQLAIKQLEARGVNKSSIGEQRWKALLEQEIHKIALGYEAKKGILKDAANGVYNMEGGGNLLSSELLDYLLNLDYEIQEKAVLQAETNEIRQNSLKQIFEYIRRTTQSPETELTDVENSIDEVLGRFKHIYAPFLRNFESKAQTDLEKLILEAIKMSFPEKAGEYDNVRNSQNQENMVDQLILRFKKLGFELPNAEIARIKHNIKLNAGMRYYTGIQSLIENTKEFDEILNEYFSRPESLKNTTAVYDLVSQKLHPKARVHLNEWRDAFARQRIQAVKQHMENIIANPEEHLEQSKKTHEKLRQRYEQMQNEQLKEDNTNEPLREWPSPEPI